MREKFGYVCPMFTLAEHNSTDSKHPGENDQFTLIQLFTLTGFDCSFVDLLLLLLLCFFSRLLQE